MARNENVVGTWKLVSALLTTLGGESRELLGEKPSGFLTYTGDGRMSVILVSGERQALSNEDPSAVPAAERAEAFATCTAYAGRYTVEENRITHHVEVSLFQNWTGTAQIRFAKLRGNSLILETPPMPVGGERAVAQLVWERLGGR